MESRRRWREQGGFKQKEISVYVSNLPAKLDKFGLRGIFGMAGRVKDSYIPVGRTVGSRSRYGFVRFGNRFAAARSIQLFNNKIIRGSKISVSIAKYDKPRMEVTNAPGTKQGSAFKKQYDGDWRVKSQSTGRDRRPTMHLDHQEQGSQSLKSLKGRVNEDFVPWLSRSLVCTTQEPRDVSSLASAIINGYGQCTKIYALSGYKFILTVHSEEGRDTALQNHEELDMWFSEIKKWDRYESCSSRKVWLEVVGVPPHGWVWENFKQIAEIWGYLICLGKPILRTDAFDSMKILIETEILSFIEENFILTIEDLGFRVHVREVSFAGSVIQVATAGHSLDDEDAESNCDVPGFEDIGRSIEPMNVATRSDDEIHNSLTASHNHLSANDKDDVMNISNLGKVNEEPILESYQARIDSVTRTKTAHLSHNECSEEVMMNLNQPRPLQAEKKGKTTEEVKPVGEEESVQEPPGFESKSFKQKSHGVMPAMLGTEDSQLKGHNTTSGCEVNDCDSEGRRAVQNTRKWSSNVRQEPKATQSNTQPQGMNDKTSLESCEKLAKEVMTGSNEELTPVPPGFEEFANIQMRQISTPPKRQKQTVERRMTRSQMKVGKSSSQTTTESMRKLAEDALAIGEILGIKVISRKKEAIKGITDSLKMKKTKRSNLK